MFALGFMFLGMLAGFLLRETSLPGLLCRLTMPCILALLFCMGALIGANPAIIDNLHTLGFQGGVLAVATLVGSLVTVLIICRCVTGERTAAVGPGQDTGEPDREHRDAS